MKTGVSFLILFLLALNVNGQSYHALDNSEVVKITGMSKSKIRNIIRVPDWGGYVAVKCDLHSHTAFSDGDLMPAARVKEAWQHGLDAIAITDHIEYRPHKMITSDHNESCKMAQQAASNLDLIVIKGTEITRSKPLGHLNALFITDANALDIAEPLDAIDTALKQGAFILWNHPGWPDNKSTLYPVHEKLIAEKKIHGVEVFNSYEYYPVAMDWCRDKGLAFTANSDVHYIVDGDYGDNLRPMTLVFAAERSEKGIRDALFAGRSVAFFNGMLAGKADILLGLMEASLNVKILNREKRIAEVSNITDIPYKMACGDRIFVFPAGKTVSITLPETGTVTVMNCFTGANQNLTFEAQYVAIQ